MFKSNRKASISTLALLINSQPLWRSFHFARRQQLKSEAAATERKKAKVDGRLRSNRKVRFAETAMTSVARCACRLCGALGQKSLPSNDVSRFSVQAQHVLAASSIRVQEKKCMTNGDLFLIPLFMLHFFLGFFFDLQICLHVLFCPFFWARHQSVSWPRQQRRQLSSPINYVLIRFFFFCSTRFLHFARLLLFWLHILFSLFAFQPVEYAANRRVHEFCN